MSKMPNESIDGSKLNKTTRNIKRLFVVLLSIAMTAVVGMTVYAAILFYAYTSYKVSVQTMVLTEAPSISSVTNSITFDKGADKKDILISVENDTGVAISHKFSLSYTLNGETEDTNMLAKAIYVYFDDEFVNTLSAICPQAGTSGEIDITNLIPANEISQTVVDTHKISLEMHIAADSTHYKNKQLNLTISNVADNADESDFIFISNVAQWKLAVDDINSGIISPTVRIVLANDILLDNDYELKNSCIIDLHGKLLDMNGHTLNITAQGKTETIVDPISLIETDVFVPANVVVMSSVQFASATNPTGNIVLNSQGCVLDIRDIKAQNGDLIGRAYSGITSNQSCYSVGVVELLKAKLSKNIGDGFAQNSTKDVFGGLSFYTVGENSMVSVNSPISMNNGNFTSTASGSTVVSPVTIGSEQIACKVFGDSEYAIFNSLFEENGELRHLALLDASNDIVTSELFLPVALKNKGVTIEWQSSNTEMMNNSGDLADEVGNKTPISLLATIKINDKVYTKSFSFVVSSQNNQTRFSSFLAQIGTLDLTSVYDGTNGNTALVNLPIIDPNYTATGYSGYDYRSEFITPVDEGAQYHFEWLGYDDINCTSIEYIAISTYSYVSIFEDGNNRALYLNTPVLNNFAQILVRATFYDDNDENNQPTVYSGFVNINIHPGTYAKLLEMVFTEVQDDLNNIDIYQNIIDTRKVGGMKNEKGDFTLSTIYKDSDKYRIEYSQSLVNNAVSDVTVNAEDNSAIIHINPVAFASVESTAYVHVKVLYVADNTIFAERDLPFRIPASIKPDDIGFDNYSVFSSMQYQVWDKLPADEKIENSGFVISDGKITNSNLPYILVRDVEKCNITDIKLLLDNDATSQSGSSEIVYNMLELIRWATGSTTETVAELGSAFAGETVVNDYNLSYGDNRLALPTDTEETELSPANQTTTGKYIFKDTSEWKYYDFTAGTSATESRSLTYNCMSFASYSYNTNQGSNNKYIAGTKSGNYFQVTTSISNNNKFVFLSEDDLEIVFNFVKGITPPTTNSVGETSIANLSTNTGYYLYCPATGFFFGQTTTNSNTLPNFSISTYADFDALKTALDNGNAKYRLTANASFSGSYALHTVGSSSGINLYGGTTVFVIGVYTISGDAGSHWWVDKNNITYTASNNFEVSVGSTIDGPFTVYGNNDGNESPFAFVSNSIVTVNFNFTSSTATVVGVIGGVSTEMRSVHSDGKEYLNPKEVEVLENYYQSVTLGLANAIPWADFWTSISYSPAGRVVTDGNALATVAKGLTTSEMYFKYYEIYMWATNIKDEVEAGGIYAYPNSGSMSGSGSYVVTNYDGTTTTFNFNNSGQDKETFGEDNTAYISAPEEAVLRHFIYAQGGGTNGTATFYTSFLANTTFPTYLNDGAVNTIISNLYTAFGFSTNTTFAGNNGFVSSVELVDGKYYPRISNCDGALYALSQFANLTSFTISGDITQTDNDEVAGMPAFLQTTSIKTFFSRLAINQTDLTTLVLRNLAQDHTSFSLEGIEKLTALTSLDLGCNYGISNIGYILNAKYKQLTYLDVCGCNVLDKFKEFTLLAVYNLAYASPTIYHTVDNSNARALFNTESEVPEALTYLHEIGTVDSAYLQLLNNSSSGENIIWDIQEGNDVIGAYDNAGNQFYNNISTIDQMEMLLASYFYCTENFTSDGVTYTEGNIYKLNYSNGVFSIDYADLSADSVDNSISQTMLDTSSATITLTNGTVPESTVMPAIPTTETLTNQNFGSAVSSNCFNANGVQVGNAINIYRMQYRTATLTQTNIWRVYGSMSKQLVETTTRYYIGSTIIETEVGDIRPNSVVSNITYSYQNNNNYIDITETITWNNYRIYATYDTNNSGSYSNIPANTTYITRSGLNYLVDPAVINNGLEYVGATAPSDPTFTYSGITLGNTIDSAVEYLRDRTTQSGDTIVFTNNGTQYNFTSGGAVTNELVSFESYYAAPLNTTATASNYIQNTQNNINRYYRYTGTAGTVTANYSDIAPQTKQYIQNNYYYVAYDAGLGILTLTNTTNNGMSYGNTNTGTTTLEGLLNTANDVRYTDNRGLYLGNYYYYTGATMTVNGHLYQQNNIYRLVYDVASGFSFEKFASCISQSNQDDFIGYIYNAVTNENFKDEYYYLTTASARWMYGANFYRLSLDETGTMMMMTFGALSETNTSRMTNIRIYDPNMYNGTGGEQEAVISATVIVDGTEYTRLFHVNVVGTQQ